MTTGEKLKHLLRLHSLPAVARAAGIQPCTLRAWTVDKHSPRLSSLRPIADVLGVDIGWLADDRRGLPVVRSEEREPATAA